MLDWGESQLDPITSRALIESRCNLPVVDAAGKLTDVSRQLWAILNPLLAHDADKATMFANVERHNGLEVWRRLAEPINEDKAMVRRDLLLAVTNPKGAATMEKVETAVEEWDTNI